MLKTKKGGQSTLVQQPHHAQVSGYLAAHWGGVNGFARPGSYPGIAMPSAVREEVILAVAEHDNGWWEWEAVPQISAADGLPVGLGEPASGSERTDLAAWRAGGYDRWRAGIERFAEPHPYAALLISLHAYWLYAVAFDDLTASVERVPRHFVFSGEAGAPVLVSDRDTTRVFLDEQAAQQAQLIERLAKDPTLGPATAPQYLGPHLRLLQLMDALSLFLALGDTDAHRLEAVPRANADDLVSLRWTAPGPQTFALDPYPFDLDPLPVHMPARMVAAGAPEAAGGPFATFHGAPMELLTFTLTRAR